MRRYKRSDRDIETSIQYAEWEYYSNMFNGHYLDEWLEDFSLPSDPIDSLTMHWFVNENYYILDLAEMYYYDGNYFSDLTFREVILRMYDVDIDNEDGWLPKLSSKLTSFIRTK